MIALNHARKEISRLSTRNGYPAHSAELGWLVDALRLGARSKEHASQVITEALDASQNCPTPDDIRTLCSEVHRQQFNQYPPSCEQCRIEDGYGGWKDGNWITVIVKHKGTSVEAAKRCSCARGQMLAAREEEEKRKAAYAQ